MMQSSIDQDVLVVHINLRVGKLYDFDHNLFATDLFHFEACMRQEEEVAVFGGTQNAGTILVEGVE